MYGNSPYSCNYNDGMGEEKRITVRLPAELHERLAAQAKLEHRSVNGEILHLLEVALTDLTADGESP